MAAISEDKKAAAPVEKAAKPVRCICGQRPVTVTSNGKKMAACPNALLCGMRSGWYGKEQDAIKNWNTLQDQEKHRRGRRGKK